jgi:hypothetical protein
MVRAGVEPRALQERLARKQASQLWYIGLIMFAISGAIFESNHEMEAMRPANQPGPSIADGQRLSTCLSQMAFGEN